MQATRARTEYVSVLPEPVSLTALTSGYLDIVRALAALAVMFGHWRAFYFVDYDHIEPRNVTLLVKMLYAATGFGHQAVMVFFVLSGFFISSSILRNYARGSWSWRDYVVDRGSRLYLVVIPGLILGLMWDLMGITFYNRTGIYSAPLLPFGDHVPTATLTPAAFIGNLLFVQTRFTPVFGSNGPLWSLFNEYWYYVLFPAVIAFILAVRRRAVGSICMYVLLTAAAAWILKWQLIGFVVWIFGCIVTVSARYYRFPQSRKWIARVYITCTATACCITLAAARASIPWLGSDVAVGASFACFVYGVLQMNIWIGKVGLMLAKGFAGFSFTLYVVHFPLLLFIRAKWMPTFRWQPDAMHLAYGCCIAACALAYAFAIARFTESNTAAVRQWVNRKIG